MTEKTEEIYIQSTLTYCKYCKKQELANIISNKNGVFMRKTCTKHNWNDVKIASNYDWYTRRVLKSQAINTPRKTRDIKKGCPLDCWLCSMHSNEIHLPVFSITNDCNLNCPICFTYNRPDKKYYKNKDEVAQIIERLLEHRDAFEVVNITGGEPTLHLELFEIIDVLKRKEIERITINTNGIKLSRDSEFARKIKEADVQMVLSLNTFDPEKSKLIHGANITRQKKKVLQVFEELNIPTTLLCVAIKDINEPDIAEIVSEYIKKDFVKSITIQNMTFTGENGQLFEPRKHITLDDVETVLSGKEEFSAEDFFCLNSSHPLCYSIAYYIVHQDRVLSLTRLIDKNKLSELSNNSYLLSSDTDLSQEFLQGINELWAEGEDTEFLSMLSDFISRLYPTEKTLSTNERTKIAETMIKAVYIHSHMDEHNFDIDRVSRCADIVPDESGSMIPACSYNLIYRENDERFWKK